MQEIRKNCTDKNFHRAYLICGDEAFLRLQAQKMLLEALGAEEGSMNFLTFEGAKTEPAVVIDACETLPFFADYRVVLVSDSGWFAKSCEEMADYLPTIPETTVLIFNERTADKRVKSYKAMAKAGHIAECVMPQEPELVRWVGGILKENGWSMKREAWPLFYERTGADMSRMKNELDKLLAYTMESKEITPADVEAVCSRRLEDRVFEMLEAMARGDKDRMLFLYEELLLQKEAPQRILSLIGRQFLQMYGVRQLRGERMRDTDIAKQLGMRDFAVAKTARLAMAYPMERLKQLMEQAAEDDARSKSGRLDAQIAVETLLLEGCRKNAS